MFADIRLAVVGVFLVTTFVIVNTERTKDRMYVELNGASCFRRLNGTHETGCTSDFGGSTGVLHVIRSPADFDFIHNKPPAPPYAVVVPTHLFTRDLIMPLQHSPHVSGIVLIHGNHTAPEDHYTHELQCPNQYSTWNNATCDAQRPESLWNPFGSGLLHVSFPFPIYYVSDEQQIATIVDCYERFNAPDPGSQHLRSLCSVQINQFMAAAGTAEMCLRRSTYELNMKSTRFCDALSGRNAFATLFARGSDGNASEAVPNATPEADDDAEQFIIVSARLDTTSMFDGLGAGAMEVLPLVTVLTAAHTLAALLPERLATTAAAVQPNVLFMFFNGEAYDYIGSQRFVYDVRGGRFPPAYQQRAPIRADRIQLVVDVASLDDPSTVHAYHVRAFERADKLLSALDKYNRAFALGVNTTGRQQLDMPPSAAQSFLRDNETWPVVTLQSPARNRYLHSVFDDARNVRFRYANTSGDFMRLTDVRQATEFAADSVQMAVRNVSTVLAFTLSELVTGRTHDGHMGASAVLADELLQCYLQTTACRLMVAAGPPAEQGGGDGGQLPDVPPHRYVSVQGGYVTQAAAMTYELLALLVGQRVDGRQTASECGPRPLVWMAGMNGTGECRLGTQNVSMARSPAFVEEDYDFASGRYSTWTESTWNQLSARIFLKPSATHEALTLAIGFVVMTCSFVLVFLVNSRSDVLFGSTAAATMIATGVANAATSSAPAQC